MLVRNHLQGLCGPAASALGPIENFNLGEHFAGQSGVGARGRTSVIFLPYPRGLGIATATGNSGVSDLGLDSRGWAVFTGGRVRA